MVLETLFSKKKLYINIYIYLNVLNMHIVPEKKFKHKHIPSWKFNFIISFFFSLN